jgi:hypothetical protein
VGDLIINSGEDNKKPVWEHVTSGYEDDYNQKLRAKDNGDSTVTVHITDGIGELDSNTVSSVTIKGNSANLQFTASGTNITASLMWDTF